MFARALHYLHSVLFPGRHRERALEEIRSLDGNVDVLFDYIQEWYPYFSFDPEFRLAMLMKDGMTLKFYPEFCHSRCLVLEAVRTNGMALQYAEDFHNDWEIVFEAVHSNPKAYYFAQGELRSDDLIMCGVLEQNPDMLYDLPLDDRTFGLVVEAACVLEVRPVPANFYMFNDRVQALATAIYKYKHQHKK